MTIRHLKIVNKDYVHEPEPPFDGGGEPPDNGDMENRVLKLEYFAEETRDRLVRIETKLETFATKEDLADAKADLVKWIVGTAVALGSAAIVVMTFVLNNAVPKVAPPPSQAPIIINVPQPSATQPTSKP